MDPGSGRGGILAGAATVDAPLLLGEVGPPPRRVPWGSVTRIVRPLGDPSHATRLL